MRPAQPYMLDPSRAIHYVGPARPRRLWPVVVAFLVILAGGLLIGFGLVSRLDGPPAPAPVGVTPTPRPTEVRR